MNKVIKLSKKEQTMVCGGAGLYDLIVKGVIGAISGFISDYAKCVSKDVIKEELSVRNFKQIFIGCIDKSFGGFVAGGSVASFEALRINKKQNTPSSTKKDTSNTNGYKECL